MDLEVTPGEVFAIVPEDGLLVHSNHFVSPAAISKVVDLSVGRSGSTLYRKHRVDEILRARAGEVGSTDIEEALSDHFGRPESVCAHTGESRPVGQTIASHISDLTTRTLRVSSGPPCMNPYVDYQLT